MTASPPPLRANRLADASAWRMTFLLVQGGGSVILSAALSHILDARAFSTTSLTQGVLVIAQTIGDFGLSQAAVTVLPARIAASPESAKRLLAGAANMYLYAGAAAFLLTLASVVIVPKAALVPIAVSAPAAAAMVLLAGADGLLRSQGEFRRPVMFVVTSELGGFIGIPVALGTHSPAWTCAAVSAGTTVGAACAVLTLRAHAGGAAHAARGLLRAAMPLGLTQAFVVLCTRVDTLLAASLTGLVAAGTFEGDWRIYQLGQYAAGALATAAAPFIASRLGANQVPQALALLRRLLLRLLGVGLVGGALLYFARWPLAHLLAGSLSIPVAHGLVFLAAVSPIAAVGLPAYYTLIVLDGERLHVLGCFILGAAVNLGLGSMLAGPLHVHGILIGCAAGTAVTSMMLLARLAFVVSRLRRAPSLGPRQSTVGKIG
jgi:O-antigen/teichoic acid export membrane protein